MFKSVAPPVTITVLSGCAAMLAPISPVPSEDYATLTVIAEAAAPGDSYGINGVGKPHTLDAPSVKVFVAKGRRTIWYGCPGLIYTDWGPSITFTFKGGSAYELICASASGNKTDFIRPSANGA